jgi:hypothetical protein
VICDQARHSLKDQDLPNCKRACVAHSNTAPICHCRQGDGRKYESREVFHDDARSESSRWVALGGDGPAFIVFSGVSCEVPAMPWPGVCGIMILWKPVSWSCGITWYDSKCTKGGVRRLKDCCGNMKAQARTKRSCDGGLRAGACSASVTASTAFVDIRCFTFKVLH